MQSRARQLRRRHARTRGLIALAVVGVIALLAGLAVARAVSCGSPHDESTRPGQGAGGAVSPAPSASAGASPQPPSVPPPVRVVSGGDVMTDRSVEVYANAHGADVVLAGIAGQLRKGDAAWVNLEGVVSTLGSPMADKSYTFEGPPAMAAALQRAGIDVVTLGNNHAVDYGRAALKDGIKRLEKAGVQVVGAGRDVVDARAPAIVTTKSGATIGFLAWNDVWWPGFTATNDQAGVAEAFRDIGHMMRDIRRLAKRVDYVVVGYHWGYEYQHYPVGQQTKEAHAAIDAGADLVIGHHPHVLQGVETYKRRLIAYSLGDLVFDHYSVESGQTVLVDAVLTPHGVTATLVPAYASSQGIPSVQHGAAGKTILALVKQYSAPLDTSIAIKGDIGLVRAGRK